MKSRAKRTTPWAPHDGADVTRHHIRHWGVASVLLIALVTIHVDLVTVAEGAGGRPFQRQMGLKKNRNDIISSASTNGGGGGAASIDLDHQTPPKPMLVPDPSQTTRDPLLSNRVKHYSRYTKESFTNEEEAMVRTRHFLRNQTQFQSNRERELRYLNMHANLLVGNDFQTKLVDQLKKVKNETEHILDLRGGRRKEGRRRNRRSVSEEASKATTDEKEMEREEWTGAPSIVSQETGKPLASKTKGEEQADMMEKRGRNERSQGKTAWEKTMSKENNGNPPRLDTPAPMIKKQMNATKGEKKEAQRLRPRRGVPSWKDYLYNLPSNERGKYHTRKAEILRKHEKGESCKG